MHGEEKKGGESKVLPSLREIISICESKGKLERFFFSHETYTRIIVINLIIVKLFGVCHVVFLFKEKRVFHVNICVLYVIAILN